MQGHKQFVDKVVLRFRLSERVPKQNLYRRLAELLDWSFLYEQTQALYSHTGQPSLDPVVFFKLMLVSRLENLVSDRRLIEHCSLRLDIRYFLGLDPGPDTGQYYSGPGTRHSAAALAACRSEPTPLEHASRQARGEHAYVGGRSGTDCAAR
jgi:transposase